jgi:uncharacterized protein YegL
VFVVTDGGSNPSSQNPSTAAQQLRSDGATVFAIGVKGFKSSELKSMVSLPHAAHIFELQNFQLLEQAIAGVISAVCQTISDAPLLLETCASENSVCYCTGEVTFGAGTTWSAPKQVAGSTQCSTAVFGDPLRNVVKTCRCVRDPTAPPSSTAGTSIPSAPQCMRGPVEIVFALDRSGSISVGGPDPWNTAIAFVESLIGGLGTGSRVGIVTFAGAAVDELPMSNPAAAGSVLARLRTETPSGFTRMDLGLGRAKVMIDSSYSAKPDRTLSRFVVLLTDGISDTSPTASANSVKATGATLLCIGVASYQQYQLDAIASPPAADSVFTVADFPDLAQLVSPMATSVCNGATSPSSTAPPLSPAPSCSAQAAVDLVFLLDESLSIYTDCDPKPNSDYCWTGMKQFAARLAGTLPVGPGAADARVGVARFHAAADVSIALTAHSSHSALVPSLLALPLAKGASTRVDEGMKLIRDRMLPGMRYGAEKILVVVTGGVRTSADPTTVAKELQAAGVKIFAVVS